MEERRLPFPLLLLPFFFPLHFLSLAAAAYNLPEKYFINCGSKSNSNSTGRTFIGDMNSSGDFSLGGKHNSPVKDNNISSNPSSPYSTARVFTQPSFYEFTIDNNGGGSYLVRLHFYPFNSSSSSSSTDLSMASFEVSTSTKLSLLQNFTVINTAEFPVIKEFILTIRPGKFRIFFTPKMTSFAFINAIEIFLTPDNFIPAQANLTKPADGETHYGNLRSRVLQPIYRINMGGSAIPPETDTLWRNWDQDDSYLLNRTSAKNSTFYSNNLNYKDADGEFIAPNLVYQTAKQMNKMNSNDDVFIDYNITWVFNVRKNDRHFLRLHFCDINSLSMNVLFFNLYIDQSFIKKINSADYALSLAVPFYLDFVFNSGNSGVLNISIGPLNNSGIKDVYLNGLEVMEITEIRSSIPFISGSHNQVPLEVSLVIAGLVLVFSLFVMIWFILKRRKPKPVETFEWSPMLVNMGGSSNSRETELNRNMFPIHHLNLGLKLPFFEIQNATSNFDPKFVIGKGGFGNVYRGMLRNGVKVAIKRSQPGSGQGLPEFQTEILVLSKIQHKHLVSLIGYCDEGSEMILVYELMEKGTLRDHLYGSNLPRLSWKQRVEICIGAARGLQYLHKGSASGIIHRDVKSTNILLDENLVAKVADFGLSRTGLLGETHVSTGVKGTFGYMDPEYFQTQQLTEKSDVYSFGVVLLEVLCARPAINPLLPREQMNLAEWAMNCKKKGLIEMIIDPTINGHNKINPSSLRKFVETVEKCLQEDSANRPTMADVLWDLEYALQLERTALSREPYEDSCSYLFPSN